MVSNCKQEEINLPLIAIGGITLKDIQPLMATGIFGFAVSSAINLSNDRKHTAQAFIKVLKKHLY
ncbi:MAG: thiamine phosphate synthase [Chitinophagales bacterium]